MFRHLVWFAAVWASAAASATAERTRLQGEADAQFANLERLIVRFRAKPAGHLAQQTFRREALILDSDRDPVDVALRRTAALLEHLGHLPDAPQRSDERARLKRLRADAAAVDVTDGRARRALFEQVVLLRRRIALSNPLLDFDRILFIKRHFLRGNHCTGNHMCDQYFGFHAIPGGGLFVLEDAFGERPTVRNVLADSVCQSGRFKGRKLLPGGFLSPELSYDGKRILFAYTEAQPSLYEWTPGSTYHVFAVDVDGLRLRQLTDGPTNDFDPCWLPGGRIAFISERRGGYGRCHARPVPIFTLHTMDPDGGRMACISHSESNEWHPSVDHDGTIVYTRWDYVDRGHSQAHHPWITTPDGRDARALQGNYGRSMQVRPFMEMDVRAIPGSHRYVSTAAAHHSQAYGSLVVIDPRVRDDDAMAPLRRLTPEIPFPESEAWQVAYATAWPLSEEFYLCVYDAQAEANRGTQNNFGIYLLDAWGNQELLYRDPAISCLGPIPLRPRPRPPILPPILPQVAAKPPGEEPATGPETAAVSVIDVRDSLKPWPKGTTIKALRIIEVLPKTTPVHNVPRIGYGSEKSARAVLGTVPVEADGSAHFSLPVGRPVFFQALDERAMAVQSMRSLTYVRPGQKLVCQGCHEPRSRTPRPLKRLPLALRRGPSKIRPEADGSNPFSFAKLVQPVLERRCVSCHAKEPKAIELGTGDATANPYHWYTSYTNLRPYAFYFGRYEAEYDAWTDPRTTPGRFGARASKLLKLLQKGHYDVKLSEDERRRITLWLDCNSDFFGSYGTELSP